MQHLRVKATVTQTDRGEFRAIAAAYSRDRGGDRIIPGAFRDTIAAWQRSGKRIPIHCDHRGEAANVIGSADPATMRETDDGLLITGQLDLDDSEVAREAWRVMKGGAAGLSFGYVPTSEREAADGVNELTRIDLFEVTITPRPMNADTRVLSMKAIPPLKVASFEC